MLRNPTPAEVVIVGGGHAGLLLAIGLDGVGISSVVVEAEPSDRVLAAPFDGRALALMHGSQQVFAALEVWDSIAPIAEAVRGVQVADAATGAEVHYDAAEVGDHLFAHGIENRGLRQRLLRHALDRPSITLIAPARLQRLERADDRIVVHLAEGRRLAASLVVGADGRRSTVRRLAGIPTTERAYGQTAITFAVRHDRPHGQLVREYLRPAGPLALLPIGPNLSSITWVERPGVAARLLERPGEPLLRALTRRIGPVLGRIEAEGKPTGYPLSVHQADRLVGPRVALIGDAGHGVHPIHAQGFNLGVRDVAALVEVMQGAKRAARPLGAAETLLRYQRWRQGDVSTVVAMTDMLNRLFSTDLEPARLVRRIGLDALDRVPPLKRLAMRRGMGLLDDRPRLARGDG